MTDNGTKHNSLGGRLRVARLEAGFTIRQLADALGVDPRTVNRWQSNDADPSIERMGLIARVLDKSPAYFLDEREVAA